MYLEDEDEDENVRVCSSCYGKGYILVDVDDDGEMVVRSTCTSCDGTGKETSCR